MQRLIDIIAIRHIPRCNLRIFHHKQDFHIIRAVGFFPESKLIGQVVTQSIIWSGIVRQRAVLPRLIPVLLRHILRMMMVRKTPARLLPFLSLASVIRILYFFLLRSAALLGIPVFVFFIRYIADCRQYHEHKAYCHNRHTDKINHHRCLVLLWLCRRHRSARLIHWRLIPHPVRRLSDAVLWLIKLRISCSVLCPPRL